MKKLLLILVAFLFLYIPVIAAEPITFQWEQPSADLPYLKGWTLYWSDVAGTGYVRASDIIYSGTPADTYTSSASLTFIGNLGTTVKKYFVLKAINKDDIESVPSNEVSYSIYIPYPLMSGPFNLTIPVVIKKP